MVNVTEGTALSQPLFLFSAVSFGKNCKKIVGSTSISLETTHSSLMYIIPGCKSSGRRLTGRKKYGSVFCFDPGAPTTPPRESTFLLLGCLATIPERTSDFRHSFGCERSGADLTRQELIGTPFSFDQQTKEPLPSSSMVETKATF